MKYHMSRRGAEDQAARLEMKNQTIYRVSRCWVAEHERYLSVWEDNPPISRNPDGYLGSVWEDVGMSNDLKGNWGIIPEEMQTFLTLWSMK